MDSDDPTAEEFLIHGRLIYYQDMANGIYLISKILRSYNQDINEILIQEVERRPILYNPSLCQEKGQKHQIRRQLWNEIYESLNHLIPFEKLPKTWKNIRDRYYKIKRGMENNQMLEMEVRPKYRYYDMLRFLDHATPERPDKQEILCKSPNSTKSA